MFKTLVKRVAGWIGGDYSAYFIYAIHTNDSRDTAFSSEAESLGFVSLISSARHRCSDPLIEDQLWYGGEDSFGFACTDGEQVVGVCYFWAGDRYRSRNFWPLRDKEAKLVQIVVTPSRRGRGTATALIRFAANAMFERGFERLYARIWVTNRPSIKAFERAGWHRIALVTEMFPPWSRVKRVRLVIPPGARASSKRPANPS